MFAGLWMRGDAASAWWARWAPRLFHPYALFLVVALAVWIPEGFRIGDTNDGWLQVGTVLQSDAAFRSNVARTFGGLPMWLGMHLDPGGFVGLQAVMLLFTLLRGVLMFEIARRLVPGNRWFALAAGLLAEFQPADRSYFWLGASGLHFAYVTALASCLAAVMHLRSRSRETLLATMALQFVSGFTYPGFVPLMVALPAGAWLLARVRGEAAGPAYLAKVNAMVAVAVVADVLLIHFGRGRDTAVADLSVMDALAGFGWAGANLVKLPFALSNGMHSRYWLPAILAGLFGLGTALIGLGRPAAAPAAPPRRETAVACAGLFGLALLSYLPYSIATVRFLPDRTLLGAGLFTYAALLLVFFTVLRDDKPAGRRLAVAALALLSGYVALTGLVKRDFWVREYRQQEHLLSALATTLPHPPPGSFILVNLQSPADAHVLRGFTTREAAFIVALRYLYGDTSLNGGFVGFEDNRVRFDTEGVHARKTMLPDSDKLFADYSHLIAVDYFPDQPAVNPLDKTWLAQQSGLWPGALKYAPPAPGAAPADEARICSMLEPAYRPAYCGD